MRVYGTSPLYNLVERIFRSKRLFIVCIVLATAILACLAAWHAGQYTATAVVLLSDNTQPGAPAPGPNQPGSVRYKLNVLRIVARDPEFIRQALAAQGLDKGKTPSQFTRFCREARNALTITTGDSDAGDNVVDITCRWPGPEAADIVSAFYNNYARRVLDEETSLTQNQTRQLQDALASYTQQEQDVDAKIAAYQSRNPGTDWQQANANYQKLVAQVNDLQNQYDQAQSELAAVKQELAHTPRTYVELRERQAPQPNSDYEELLKERVSAENKLRDLRQTYTDADPKVIHARQDLADIQYRVRSMERQMRSRGQSIPVSREQEAANPQYDQLVKRRDDLLVNISSLAVNLKNARGQLAPALAVAKKPPRQQMQYADLSQQKDRLDKIRQSLTAQLDQALLNERRDRQMHLAEVTMEVRPQAEKDVTNTRSLVLYAVGPLLGLLVAFAFSLVAESMDHSLRTPADVEKYLGKPVLAVLPRLPSAETPHRQLGSGEEHHPFLPS